MGQGAEPPPASTAPAAQDPYARGDPPILALTLWPNRSLTPAGGSWLLGLLALGFTPTLLMLGGTQAGWGMLPFVAGALIALFLAIRRSERDAALREELRLWPDLITVVRREPQGQVRRWHANPFWVRLRLREDGAVEKYLTLQGNGREIELGAFLSPWERVALHAELGAALGRLRQPD